jgi:hypothetical protein
MPENKAPEIISEVAAPDKGGLTVRHSRNRRTDGRKYATGTATGTTQHSEVKSLKFKV